MRVISRRQRRVRRRGLCAFLEHVFAIKVQVSRMSLRSTETGVRIHLIEFYKLGLEMSRSVAVRFISPN